MNNKIIEEIKTLLNKGNAHASLDDALSDLAFEKINQRPHGLPYSIWELAEHIRIAQWDILQFCKDAKHASPKWPDEYWPEKKNPSKDDWEKCKAQISTDREQMIRLLEQSGDEIFDVFPYGTGQSLFREALVLADHNSYHTAQIILVRRLLRAWPHN